MKTEEQTNRRLFNKLYTEMYSVKKLKNPILKVNNIILDKEIRYLYYSKKNDIWFGYSETKRKYLYFFGKQEQLNINTSIMIDFDKKNNINENSLGLINNKSDVLINKDILLNKYPEADIKEFNEHMIHHFKNGHKIEISAIELGNLDSDFISNLNQFIQKIPPSQAKNRNKKKNHPINTNNINQANSKTKNNEIITEYIKLINDGKTNKEAFETLDIPRFKVKNWKRQGQLGNKDYKEFYDTYLFAVNREEKTKINHFIDLINEGKSNDEARKIIKMPEFKIKQWVDKGKNGEEEYIEFYKAYTKQNENLNSTKETPTVKTEKKTNNDDICEICGRTLPKNSKDKLCKRCIRKQRCANIVQDILPSIDPGIPFKRDDLKKLGLNKMQVQDYIWTLQEFSLITKEKNNKFSLIERKKLDEFIKESGVEIKKPAKKTIKLTKKCLICGETLEISKFPVSENTSDGYEDTCKNCKKLVTAAGYLKELLQNVKYGEEFSENDLKKYYPDPFLLQAKIWSLQENDLLILNFETQKYRLTDENKCEEFLDKYFEKLPEPITTKIPKPPKEPVTPEPHIPEEEPAPPKTPTRTVKTKKQIQMETVLKMRSEGKTRKEAAKIAGISLYKITHWYKEGRDGFGEDNVYFFKELKKIEKRQQNILKKNMEIVLGVLKSGGSKSNAAREASINESDIDEWIKLGSKNKKPYDKFKKQYDKIYEKSNDYNNPTNARKRKLFLENIRNGETRKDSAKKAKIDLKIIDSWIINGTKGKKPYDEFYNEYKTAREISKEQPISDEKRIKQQFINLLKQGYSHGEASRKIENGSYAIKIKKWHSAGKQGVKNHLKFYLNCQKAKNTSEKNRNKLLILISDGVSIKEACELTNLDPVKIKEEILKGMDGIKPYDKFYIQILESKTKQIDITQIFDGQNEPNKEQMIDFLNLLISGHGTKESLKALNIDVKTFNYWIQRGKQEFGELYVKFYKTYNKIISGEIINQFNSDIKKEIEQELSEIENEDANILEPLPKKIRMKFNSFIGESYTGFAWVNKEGNLWTYSLRKNRRNIKLTDTDLIELHKKVIKNNLRWGVLDLDKAKESLRINENSNDEKNKNEDILRPLPEDLKANFSKGTSTGFAWVSKSGNNFYYIRNNLDIKFKENSIENLYQRVIDNDLDWGVLSVAKAKKTLEDSPKVPISTSVNTDILAPLPEDIEKELSKYSKGSKTGFAWVGKSGKKYSYERVVNGTFISIREPTIEELHKKVINRNLTWGVRDLEKAKQTLSEKTETPNENRTIEVTTKSKNIFAPFPEEFEYLFKSNPTNKSGIAWVSKIGNRWLYTKRINGKLIEIHDNNIFKLHKKVINANQLWGIRDYEKAIISLISRPIDDKDYILKSVTSEIPFNHSNNTGFALVDKKDSKFEYARKYNGKSITDTNIFGLYEQILEKNLFWGVTDIEKVKTLLNIEKLPEEDDTNKTKNKQKTEPDLNIDYSEEIISTDILAPLPKKYEDSFKSVSMNKTGIAWVNKVGNLWVYSRQVNGESVRIKDENLFNLHEKVIENNLVWGIRDHDLAEKVIYNNNDEIENQNENILKPLPLNIEQKLRKNSKNNSSGFAWVSKIGDKWQYTRVIDSIPIHLKDKDIYKLHEVVVKNKYLWGVRDLKKAKQTLRDCNKKLPTPPKIEKIPKKTVQKSFSTYKTDDNQEKNTPIKYTDILAPLPEEYEKTIKIGLSSKTGIAWVTKIGNFWVYSKQINREYIAIQDSDIYKLHKKVLKAGHVWGIRDYNKAKKIIYDAQPPEDNIKPQKENHSNVFVTYNGNIVSINGKIKTEEVLKVLTTIYGFGNNILKLDTKQNNDETTLSIELNLDDKQKLEFEEKIKEFGWNIN